MLSEKGQQNSINSSGSIITPQIKLAMTLRYLVGGNPLDICFGYGISDKTFYRLKFGIWNVLEAIYEVTKGDIQLRGTKRDPNQVAWRDRTWSVSSSLQILSPCKSGMAFSLLLWSSPPSTFLSTHLCLRLDIFQHNLATLVPDYITDAIMLLAFTWDLTLIPFGNYQRLSVVLHNICLSLFYQSPRNLLLFLLTFSFDLFSLWMFHLRLSSLQDLWEVVFLPPLHLCWSQQSLIIYSTCHLCILQSDGGWRDAWEPRNSKFLWLHHPPLLGLVSEAADYFLFQDTFRVEVILDAGNPGSGVSLPIMSSTKLDKIDMFSRMEA